MSSCVFNWADFGELRVASASEEGTARALAGHTSAEGSGGCDAGARDAGKAMLTQVRSHLFFRRPVSTSAYFTFIVTRWRNNVERRGCKEHCFTVLQAIGDTVFEWLLRLEQCVTLTCLPEADITSLAFSTDASPVLPNEVFERLQRVFRLLVFRTNCLNAERGYPFQTAGAPETGHLNFYIKHLFNDAKEQKQFMSRKRKEMSIDHVAAHVVYII
jgi:hypothetical protein